MNDDSNSESCSIFVPHGFAEGRELPTVAQVMPQQRSKSALLMRSLCTMYSTNSTATPSRFSGSRFVSSLLTSALHYTSLFYSDATSLSHTQTHTQTKVRQTLSLVDVKWDDFVTAPDFGKYAYGRVNWDPKTDPALYVRIPPQLLNKDSENTNFDLLASSQNLSAGGASPLGGGRDRESEGERRGRGASQWVIEHLYAMPYATTEYPFMPFLLHEMHNA